MAYVQNVRDDEKENAPGAMQSTSGVVDAVASGAGSGADAGNATAQNVGSGYVNLAQYLTSNAGKGANLAGDITQDVVKNAEKLKSSAGSTAESGVTEMNKAAGSDKAAELTRGIQSNASSVEKDATQFLQGGYSGPKADELVSGLKSQAQGIKEKGNLLQSETGQQAALANTYGKQGPYTSGYGILDQFILSGDSAGQAKLADTQKTVSDATKKVDDVASQLVKEQQRAEAELKKNKEKVADTARAENSYQKYALRNDINDLNRNIGRGRYGSTQASAGDVLDEGKARDLEALARLAGENPREDLRKKTYKRGETLTDQDLVYARPRQI